ncbi:Predicted flavoprotein CzcO associated with the cation diffusion facilitator CzcD [Solimonas aquatica]|uniref:Predicted flavoprotein CzcO associated with the cation diffusion facilitator CzcD n=1 Tax=Solimonas aquatica TaxID=489703 RepID=A0A1H9EY05_9GAMM|nr:NAD(P)/FAD-dependent oxidoreductase [Solimonas aquatica]SEQ30542.1 Predicted flavoprotein CzcO associated with the cation diffusion facilitator CzcD [Solimonas aquatica]
MTARVPPPSTTIETEVAIVGAGFGGLCMAIKLLEAGRKNFVILEKAMEVGGTWRDNQYPGAACDVQSHMYSYSFAPKADWSQRYPGWREIQDYILDVTKRYGLRPFIRFGQEVTGAEFLQDEGRWKITTRNGDVILARHWVLASGPLHVPAVPDIPGLKDFKGKIFHSAQWDHSYDLNGKNVASIGTGGSAVQYLPEIAPKVNKLHVFQRTAAWVIPRDMRKYSDFSKKLFAAVPLMRKLHRARLYWTNESRVWPIFNPPLARALQKLATLFIRAQVKDPELARKLTPDYTIGCKRVLISNVYFPTFNRDNVELVTDGIREVREHSIVGKDGVERPVDCIVLGTGFVVDPRVYMKDFKLTGRDGHNLAQDWARAPEAYLGMTVSGYPNLFQLVGPGTALGHNSIIFMIEAQVHYIIQAMKEMEARGAAYVDVKPEVQRAFNADVQKNLKNSVWSTGCQSWYQTADGVNFTIWPWSTWRFWLRTRKVKAEEYEWVSLPTQKTRKAPQKVAA